MKSRHLLQIFVLLVVLFSVWGKVQPARASTSSIHDPDDQQVPPVVYIVVDPASVKTGESLMATVYLDNIPVEGYTSVELTCSYDPSLLEVSNITIADLFGADPVAAINGPQDGQFIVAIAGSHDNKATGIGSVVAFNVKGLQAGQTALYCKVRASLGINQLINIYSVPAQITILGDPLTPTVVPARCDKAEFLADISVPPGTVMSPGATFTKTWRLTNVGSCTWTTSYRLAFLSGEQMGAISSAQFTRDVAPGQIVDLSLSLTAPSVAGSYRGYWIFQNDTGKPFGIGPQGNQPWFVDIVVSNATLTPTPTASISPIPDTPTPGTPTGSPTPSLTPGGPTATPASGVAYDFATNACSAVWFSGAGQLPCPGSDGDPRGFVLKLNNPRLETGVIDARPGLLTFPQNIQSGYIQGFYPPFHVQNGDRFRAILNCEAGAIDCYVAFRLDYQIGSTTIETFWTILERYEGQYYSADIDLSRLAGQDVKFILTVLSLGPASGDRALWVGPIIYRTGMISTPVAEASFTPTITPTSLPAFTPSPTQTFLPTPTDPPTALPEGSGHISGRVYAGKPVIVNVFDANNTPVASIATGSDGVFGRTLSPGTYTVIATADGFLSARGFVTITDGNISTMPTINLLTGDIDNNNIIDQFDALTIGMNYNKPFPEAADLNKDGIINVLDLELLAKNYRKMGPVDWQ